LSATIQLLPATPPSDQTAVRGLLRQLVKWLPLGLLTPLLLIAAWEVAADLGLVNSFIFPAPRRIFAALVKMAISGELLEDLGVSLGRVMPGFLIGSFVGVASGLLMGWFQRMDQAFRPLISALYTVPKIALLPLFILWFGIHETSKILLIAFAAFFFTNINAASGLRTIDAVLVKAARSLGLNRRQLFIKVFLPGALPAIMAGLRLGFGNSLLVLVAAEMIAANSGIGYLIINAGFNLDVDKLFAAVFIFSLLGVLSNYLLQRLEARFGRWRVYAHE
jgi:ABC-type nitrate/sulfonate/bicarbonate transport system permease component